MVPFIVTALIVLWLVAGYWAGRITVIEFESKFGQGWGDGISFIMALSGLVGLAVSAVMSSSASVKASLNMAPAPHTGDTILHDKRGLSSRFFAWGVKGLPEDKDYWSENRGWDPVSKNFIDYQKYLDTKSAI